MNRLFQFSISRMQSILQLSLIIVLAMLSVFVTGPYSVNNFPLLFSFFRDCSTEESMAVTTPPSVSPKLKDEQTIERKSGKEELLLAAKMTRPGISSKLKYDQTIEDAAEAYGLDSALLYAVISVESHYDAKALSKKGASGLMQLMPNIAKHYGVVDLLDPVQNLQGGAQYLRDMLILFKNDISLAVAAYNAGETAVVRYGNRIPPYTETMIYVLRVLNLYQEYRINPPRLSSDARV